MATASYKFARGGDFLVHMESFQYNLLSLPVENAGAATVVLGDGVGANGRWQIAGYPVVIDANQTKASLVEVGLVSYDEAQCNGFLVAGPKNTIAAAGVTAEKYSVIWNGPGVLNEDVVPTADATDTAFTLATLKSAITTNWGIDATWVANPNDTVQTS